MEWYTWQLRSYNGEAIMEARSGATAIQGSLQPSEGCTAVFGLLSHVRPQANTALRVISQQRTRLLVCLLCAKILLNRV